MGILIVAALAHAEDVNHGQKHKDRSNGDDAQRHADAIAAHALFARTKILLAAVIAVITPAVSAAMADLAWPSAAQLGLALDLYAIANDRHKLL